eukprot:12916386-Prorocentrum_lima.AAC.1
MYTREVSRTAIATVSLPGGQSGAFEDAASNVTVAKLRTSRPSAVCVCVAVCWNRAPASPLLAPL